MTDSALWLLQTVQAAVAARAASVHFELTRDHVTVTLDGPRIPLDLNELTQASDGPLARLRAAAETCLSHHPTSLVIDSRQDLSHQSWTPDGCESSSQAGGPARVEIRAHFPSEGWLSRLLPSSEISHLRKTLVERCHVCPIPVTLGSGGFINTLSPERIVALHSHAIPLPILDSVSATAMQGTFHWMVESCWLTTDARAFCLPGPLFRSAITLRVEGRDEPFVHVYDSPIVPYSYLRGDLNLSRLRHVEADPEQGLNLDPLSEKLLLSTEGRYISADKTPAQKTARHVTQALGWVLPGLIGQVLLKNPYDYVIGTADYLDAAHDLLVPDVGLHQRLATAPGMMVDRQPGPISLPAVRHGAWLALRAVPEGPGLLLTVEDGILSDPVEFESLFPGTAAILAQGVGGSDPQNWIREQEKKMGDRLFQDLSNDERTAFIPERMLEAWRALDLT